MRDRMARVDELKRSAEARVGGTIDNRYRLDSMLGVGTSGAVYRATNTWAGRECAIKLFHYEGANQENALHRFIREAQVANRVRKDGRVHPNVVDILDVGRDAATQRFYTVLELLRGETLDAWITHQPMNRAPVGDAVAMMLPVIDAIACAHELGVVHRDLKPDNVFLAETAQGLTPKVLDFGIAQLQDARMTGAADVMGTPRYMSPESFADASKVDARADVWSLGVILYELVAGEAPFGGGPHATIMTTFQEILLKDPVSLDDLGLMHAPAWHIVRTCLQRDVSLRYANARALQTALDEVFFPV